MDTIAFAHILTSLLIWTAIFLLPCQPWRSSPFLDASPSSENIDLSDITVLIPARNEAEQLRKNLPTIRTQGEGLRFVIVDDRSDDGTAEVAQIEGGSRSVLIRGKPLPEGWIGKLWALEQGIDSISTELTLLLDADIRLAPNLLQCLKKKLQSEDLDFVSLMARPSISNSWEKLLMPPFVYFFKMLYPFRLANSRRSKTAAAAGGCILMKTMIFDSIGGISPLRSALIDDCALARRVKESGFTTWIGLSHSVESVRPYPSLAPIREMVARTAFTQLNYSALNLVFCSIVMTLLFVLPPALLLHPSPVVQGLALSAFLLLSLNFLPTLRFYKQSPLWSLTMPLAAMLFIAMTWTSALRYWQGNRSHWKGRIYQRSS